MRPSHIFHMEQVHETAAEKPTPKVVLFLDPWWSYLCLPILRNHLQVATGSRRRKEGSFACGRRHRRNSQLSNLLYSPITESRAAESTSQPAEILYCTSGRNVTMGRVWSLGKLDILAPLNHSQAASSPVLNWSNVNADWRLILRFKLKSLDQCLTVSARTEQWRRKQPIRTYTLYWAYPI